MKALDATYGEIAQTVGRRRRRRRSPGARGAGVSPESTDAAAGLATTSDLEGTESDDDSSDDSAGEE